MKDILHEIIEKKAHDLQVRKKNITPSELEKKIAPMHFSTRSMRSALQNSPSGIIAEFKRRSPSKGYLQKDADIKTIVQAYEKGGASAISVLADTPYFGGSVADIEHARACISLPILCKDFIIDPYQLYEARCAGANAVLLIAAALDIPTCHNLAAQAQAIGLEVLLEIHSEKELSYLSKNVDMLGVNNRHLGSFHTDVAVSFAIADKLPKGKQILVSESGISDIDTIKRLRSVGFRGFLMGEHFMRQANPELALSELVAGLR